MKYFASSDFPLLMEYSQIEVVMSSWLNKLVALISVAYNLLARRHYVLLSGSSSEDLEFVTPVEWRENGYELIFQDDIYYFCSGVELYHMFISCYSNRQ